MSPNGFPASPRFDEALVFTLAHHAGQLRKGTAIPYVTHPVAVAEELAYYYPDDHDLTLAGLLHDVVEDTHASIEVVEERFGPRVAILVRAVSKPTGLVGLPEGKVEKWKAQRRAMLASLQGQEKGVFRLKAADAMVNLRAIHRDLQNPSVGEHVWSRFKVGREDSLWYYEQIVESLEPIAGEQLFTDLVEQLASVSRLDAQVP